MPKFEHINDCVDALKACENRAAVEAVLEELPMKFGMWWIDIDEDASGRAFYVVNNQWWDKNAEEYCIDEYELDIPLAEEDEEELEIDSMYHDASEQELRKMGCFGEEDEE